MDQLWSGKYLKRPTRSATRLGLALALERADFGIRQLVGSVVVCVLKRGGIVSFWPSSPSTPAPTLWSLQLPSRASYRKL